MPPPLQQPLPPHLQCPRDLRAAGTEAARDEGGHPCSPGAFIPRDRPTRKSLSEGNQPGSAERPWLWMNLRVFGLRPASGPRLQRSRGESRSPPAARRRRQPGTAWARGGWCEETQSERQNLLGAAFWRFLYRPPGWLRAFCRQPGAPAHPAPGQLPHIAPFLLRARLRGEWGASVSTCASPTPPPTNGA